MLFSLRCKLITEIDIPSSRIYQDCVREVADYLETNCFLVITEIVMILNKTRGIDVQRVVIYYGDSTVSDNLMVVYIVGMKTLLWHSVNKNNSSH